MPETTCKTVTFDRGYWKIILHDNGTYSLWAGGCMIVSDISSEDLSELSFIVHDAELDGMD